MRRQYQFRAGKQSLELGKRTLLMGVLNVTPDSFSDGGRYLEPDSAIEKGLRLFEAGADILDIGGESSRPGSSPVSESEELDRVIPVVEKICASETRPVSIDTCKSKVAQTCLERGAVIVNDISALRYDSKMAEVVRRFEAGVVLMHMRGSPSTMHLLPESEDILEEVIRELGDSVGRAQEFGISRDRMLIDPGIGFGKNTKENLQILNRLSILDDLELPILVGPSRKRFIGHILGKGEADRLLGTAAACAVSVIRGAHILRVHDVEEIRQVSRVVDAIETESFS